MGGEIPNSFASLSSYFSTLPNVLFRDEDEPEMVDDATAEKPEGWLDIEEELIPDPNAERPSDWDDDMDGEWEPPMISKMFL